jgi:hypothetical protein
MGKATKAKESKMDISSYNGAVTEYLGSTVFWTVHRNHVPVEKAQEASVRVGMDFAAVIKPPNAKKAFTRSAKRVGKSAHQFARKVTDNPAAMKIGLVSEKIDIDAERLHYSQDSTAVLDKERGTVEVRGEGGNEFLAHHAHYSDNYTDADIRAFLTRVVCDAADGVALRPTGGIYFVPRDKNPVLEKLDAFLNDLGAGTLFVMRVPKGAAESNVAARAFVEEAREKIEEIVEAACRISKRAKCLENQADKLKELQLLSDRYAELTEQEEVFEALRNDILAAETIIFDRISEVRNS